MAQNTRTGDLTSGPMLQKIILFSLPLAASSILQLLFNAADVVVVGRFAGSTALAAVGSNGALINLLVNLFVGLSLGANVVAARCFGAKDDEGVRNTVQTSVTLGLVSGFLLAVVGFFAARVLLELMSCPEDVIGLSTLYLKIYFIGMPMTMLYNFSSALLRAVGDTRRPLFCLAVAGVINVVLNLVFVILFSMSVAGVALATIISQTVSACMVTALLVKEKGPLHLDLGHLGFHAGALGQILRIGLPAGLQSTVFSLSNVVIQSAVNSFGSIVVAGNSAASNLEGFVYTAMNAFAQAAVTFTSQNMGARRYDNLDRVMRNCLLCSIVTGLVLGGGASLLGEQLLHFYSSDEVVVTAGLARMHIICTTYLLCGCMDVLASCLRTLCTQFIRSRMLNRLVAIDGVLTTLSLLLYYLLFLSVLKMGATGFLLANALADLTSMVFVFIAGGCWRYFKPKAFDKTLWKEMLRYCLPMIPASISFWIINASDMFFVQGMCEGYAGRSGNHWVGLLSAGYFLPQIITILGSIFYEAWQLSAVTEETDREAFFSKIFRVYASVLFCCVAGIIMLCQLLMRVFKAEYFDAWTFVPFLTLCSMLTCLNQFLNSVYVVYKRSTGSLFTMLAGAVLNLILNYLFILQWGPWGVTPASFLSLMLVFLLRAYSTRGLLEIDFHPAWLVLNLALVLAEIWCMMNLTHWVLPVVGITAVVCVLNIREVLSMLDTLIGKFLKKRKN